MPFIKALDIPQWVPEVNTAPGAPSALVAAATSKIACKDFFINVTDIYARDKLLKSLALANRGNEVVTERGTRWEIAASPLIPDQFHYWLDMALQAAPVKTGAGPTYTWTATMNPVGAQARTARSLQFRLSDGTLFGDYAVGGAVVTDLEITGGLNAPITFVVKGFGRRIQTQAITAALSLPAIVEMPFALSKVFIEDATGVANGTWGALGTSQVLAQIRGWKFRYQTGLEPAQTADARSDQDYILSVLNPDNVKFFMDIDLLIVGGAASAARWLAEKAAAEGNYRRAIRLEVSQTIATVAYDLQIDALMKNTLSSFFPGVDMDLGQHKGVLHYEGSTDDTQALRIAVSNSITAAIT